MSGTTRRTRNRGARACLSAAALTAAVALFGCSHAGGAEPAILLPLSTGELRSELLQLRAESADLFTEYVPPAQLQAARFVSSLAGPSEHSDLGAADFEANYPLGLTWQELDRDLAYALDGLKTPGPLDPLLLEGFSQEEVWIGGGSSATTEPALLPELEARYVESRSRLERAAAGYDDANRPAYFAELTDLADHTEFELAAARFVVEYWQTMSDVRASYLASVDVFETSRRALEPVQANAPANGMLGWMELARQQGDAWERAADAYGAAAEAAAALERGAHLAHALADLVEGEVDTASLQALTASRLELEARHQAARSAASYMSGGPTLINSSSTNSCLNPTTQDAVSCYAAGGRQGIDLLLARLHWDREELGIEFEFFEREERSPLGAATDRIPQEAYFQLVLRSTDASGGLAAEPVLDPRAGASAFVWWYPYDGAAFASRARGPFEQELLQPAGEVEGVNVAKLDSARYRFSLASELLQADSLGDDVRAVTLQVFNGARFDQIAFTSELGRFAEPP